MNSKQKVQQYIKETNMLPAHAKVTVALSGGADSVALLKTLCMLGYEVSAMHINHNLRGAEADRDELFSKELCARLSVPFKSVSVDVMGLVSSKELSVETAARKLRYDALCSVGTEYIATAHTMSDNAETVLLNLIRGGSTDGMAGIPPILERKDKFFVRPLLCLTRRETERLAEEYVTDSTNNQDEATRNRIRHFIMPLLKKENPSVEETIFENCRFLREEAAYMKKQAKEVCKEKLSVSELSAAEKPIAARAVMRHLRQNSVPVSKASVEAVMSLVTSREPSAMRDLHGIKIKRKYDELVFEKKPLPPLSPMEITMGENILSDGGVVKLVEGNYKINNLFTNLCIDKDKINGNLTLRTRKQGDAIHTSGGTRTLKKAHIDNKVPKEQREHMPVICDGNSIVCAFGCGVDSKYAAVKNTKNIICITYEGNKNEE